MAAPFYSTGTVTLTQYSTAVSTGGGCQAKTLGWAIAYSTLRPNGYEAVTVADFTSDSAWVLAKPWPHPNCIVSYELWPLATADAILGKVNHLLNTLADGDLAAIAGLSPNDSDILQRKDGGWVNRSVAQFLTDLRAAGAAVIEAYTPPGPAASGAAGTVAYDAAYLYICVATNTWRRTPLASW